MNRTFCVVDDNGSHHLIRAVSVFEVRDSYAAHQNAITAALASKRPVSLVDFTRSTHTGTPFFYARFWDRLPFRLAGREYYKVSPHQEL